MKHPVDAHVGKRIRHRRWMAGLTQQQLADKVGVKFQQIQKYETGMNRVSASRLWDIAEAMSVPISFFFDGLDQKAETSADFEKDTLEVAKDYETLRDNEKDAVKVVIKSFRTKPAFLRAAS